MLVTCDNGAAKSYFRVNDPWGGCSVDAVIDRSIAGIIAGARADGRSVLLDPEGFAVLQALDIPVPRHLFVPTSTALDPAELTPFPGDRLVIKVVTPWALHKTDVGGVVVVPNDPESAVAALQSMERRFRHQDVAGYTVSECVPHDESVGSQLLLGARWTDDFGPVVIVAPGGIQADFLAESLGAEASVALFSPASHLNERLDSGLTGKTIIRLATESRRGRGTRMRLEDLSRLVAKFLDFASRAMPHDLTEFEINPLVAGEHGPVALDVLMKLGSAPIIERSPRPLARLRSLLEPESIAIVGVSESRNIGRTILDNVIAEGFPPDRVRVVKPNASTVAGVACYPTISDLPERVDLMVLSIAAGNVPDAIDEIIAGEKAESIVVIPGGIGERSGTEGIADRITAAIERSRPGRWGGPVVNGGNCMGVRSVPGRYNTVFLPSHKLPAFRKPPMPLALISQSGAFLGSTISKLGMMNPRYVISVGNQIDLTVGDYLTYLMDDPDLQVFACYVEGFRSRDGERWLAAAAEITAGGRVVLLYRAGRTAAGMSASASHTASIAGDFLVANELARGAGVVVADTLADFTELTKLFCLLRNKQVSGWRIGAVSNAGFECVAIADNAGRFELHQFDRATSERLEGVFRDCGIDAIVQVTNPADLTPVMGDEAFEAAVRAVLDGKNVDVGIVGCVPLTGALNTLQPGASHGENVLHEGSIAGRLARVWNDMPKPWVAVVDAGALYDTMAMSLEEHGVPVFRTADRALRMLERFCHHRLEATGPQTTPAATPGTEVDLNRW